MWVFHYPNANYCLCQLQVGRLFDCFTAYLEWLSLWIIYVLNFCATKAAV